MPKNDNKSKQKLKPELYLNTHIKAFRKKKRTC